MTRTPDEIKKGLECCSIDDYHCGEGCPYKDNCLTENRYKALEADALALIQQLQDENAQQARCIENMTDKLNAMNDEVAKLQAERDAAVAALKSNCVCYECKWFDDDLLEGHCTDCHSENSSFEWRGVQKEDGNASD